MCVIAVSFQPDQDISLLVIANRDEFYARPTQAADWWTSDAPDILGGRDLSCGGTWLAVNKIGRFAAVTNIAFEKYPADLSRGLLVRGFLESELSPMEYLESLAAEDYGGFNLLVYESKTETLAYLSNRGNKGPRKLSPGIYGLSNATLDEPWKKVVYLKDGLLELEKETQTCDSERLFQMLGTSTNTNGFQDGGGAADMRLEYTPPFRHLPEHRYGTRCSTIVRCHQNGYWEFTERRFDERCEVTGETNVAFTENEERD